MKLPLVSIIITTYNRAHLVSRAIESVLNQTYRNIELIVVDDYSQDDTERVVSIYFDKGVKYIKNDNNYGLSGARNIGIIASKGEFISFLDDDDELLPQKVEKQVELFQKQKGIDIVYCGSFKKYRGNSIEVIPTNRGNIYLNALRDCPNAVHTLMIKHECFKRIGLFDEFFHTFEDWDLWIRLAKYFKFDFVDEPLVIYHFHGQQMVMELDRKILAGQMILEKHFEAICVLPDILFWHYRKLLTRCSLAGDYNQAFLYLIKALKIKPFRLDTYLHLILMHINKPLQRKLIYKFGLVKIGDIYII